jgi:uncharacterized protein (TIGR00288 family)
MEMRLNGPQIAVFIDFENVAISAGAEFESFDISAVMELLRARGRLLIKRAYADWGRYSRYRRAMLENGVDLFQLYTVGIQQKNRADVRLAIDAVETVFTRPNIDVYAIVSGDSDFTELIHKLRDHGKYTIGIGLRAATSDLLRRACDEFVFYETLVSEELGEIADEIRLPDPRELLLRALSAAEQKGETPVFAGRLKQIMLGLDSSFTEANYGFQRFRDFLEANQDALEIQEEGLQLYVSLRPGSGPVAGVQPRGAPAAPLSVKPSGDLGQRYRNFLRESGPRVVEPGPRQQVAADFLTTLQAQPRPISLTLAADLLKDRYDAENAVMQKVAVNDVARLIIMSEALGYAGGQPAGDAPVLVPEGLASDTLNLACDAVYAWRIIEGGLPLHTEALASVLYGASSDGSRVGALFESLAARRKIIRRGESYALEADQTEALVRRPELGPVIADLLGAALPAGEPVSPASAERLFREASELRQHDFAGSAERYLQAARIQLEALRAGVANTGLDDLKWYLASYASVKAGQSFVRGRYDEALPHYLAFFGLANEGDSVWPRIQRLVNPMLSYYFALAGKQLGESVPPNLGRSPASQTALRMHNHDNAGVGAQWESLMSDLAGVNLAMARHTLRELNSLLPGPGHVLPEADPRVMRTRAFLIELVAAREKGEEA